MKFQFKLTGTSPLLMHADDIELSDRLQAWRKDSANRNQSVPGDDRSPPWTWQTYLCSDGDHIAMPSEYLSASLLSAGAMMTLKGKKTFKEASQTGVFLHDDFMPILIGGKPVKMEAVESLAVLEFGEQAEGAKKLGFYLYMKRAKVNKSKHVRVRPRFDEWAIKGTVEIVSKDVKSADLKEMFTIAGFYKGLGDWRPGSPTRPGRFGRFGVALTEVK